MSDLDAGEQLAVCAGERNQMDWEGFFTHYRKPGFIPGYEIVNKLGSGVFGEVFKARKESIGKFYAIKFLKLQDEKISEAIFKELDSLRHFAHIDHPNLVTIEDQGEAMGIPYIVMSYGGDETLKRRLAAGRLEFDQVDHIFRQIAQGVGALHRKSIIHFDLKPANVFMRDDHARVGDYGLSKLVSESHNTMSIGRGTPYYMAPEMLKRRGDHRSDMYSLGVILFEMVTGEVPFKGDSEWEVLRKHESEAVVIPPEIPDRYRHAIEGCLRKDPETRTDSVELLLSHLDGTASPGAPAPKASRSAVAGSRPLPVPPPLPSHRRSGEQVREQIGQIVGSIRGRGGAAVERARQVYQDRQGARAAVSDDRHLDLSDQSFHADFDVAGAPDSEFVEALPEQKPKNGLSNRFFRMVAWPFRALLRLLGVFFHNFFRYAFVLAITVGLCFLVHAALRDFSPELW
jgi:serine/threonine protein kinase